MNKKIQIDINTKIIVYKGKNPGKILVVIKGRHLYKKIISDINKSIIIHKKEIFSIIQKYLYSKYFKLFIIKM